MPTTATRRGRGTRAQRQRESMAYHEAGHAVVAWSLGFEVLGITILPNKGAELAGGAYSGGYCSVRVPRVSTESPCEAVRNRILQLLAGPVAESRHDRVPFCISLALSGSDDIQQVHQVCEAAGRSDFYHVSEGSLIKETGRLLSERWPVVESLRMI